MWRQIDAGIPIYDRKLTADEVRRRIERCWKPYHEALAKAVDAALRHRGRLWHLNLHSMPNDAYEPGASRPSPERRSRRCGKALPRRRGYTL